MGVGVVGEQAIAPSAREFLGDAQVHQGFEGLAGGGEAQAAQLLELLFAGERPSAQGRVARLWRACRGLASTTAGSGGSGAVTKARTVSPAVLDTS